MSGLALYPWGAQRAGHKPVGLTVTKKNWRMTFRINEVGAIEDIDLEDDH
ncbi:hypothetical protein [Bosea sp. LC85]|nr:hypothetical protein [Bosea sp. LC85]